MLVTVNLPHFHHAVVSVFAIFERADNRYAIVKLNERFETNV
jgi:hypothetical protein